MDEENEAIEVEAIEIDMELRCPTKAWTDGKENITEAMTGIIAIFNKLIDDEDMSGAAITFVLHKLAEVYVRAMFDHFKDEDSRSSIYVMSAQMMNAHVDTYEALREKMPQRLLRLLEEPTQGAA